MKSLEIKGNERKELGKSSIKKLRVNGNVPCVIYGGEKNIHFSVFGNDLKNLVYTPNVYLVHLNIDGKSYKAIMKDIQFHPVTDHILHVDFIEVFEDRPAIIKIPVEITGSSIGIKNGGKLRLRRRNLKVKGLVKYIPDTLNIDVTKVDIGDVIKIDDLSYPNLEILDPGKSMVVGVISSRLAAKGMTVEDTTTTTETTEVVEGDEATSTAAAEEETSKEE
jgi:large subunit ribosomal protein L25